MASDEVVLLTGLPSLLARAVCLETLRADAGARVEAVVRAKRRSAPALGFGTPQLTISRWRPTLISNDRQPAWAPTL